ncbi:hypothetical protein ABIB66_005982 [Bradyrhizobium sp. F1.13.3]
MTLSSAQTIGSHPLLIFLVIVFCTKVKTMDG